MSIFGSRKKSELEELETLKGEIKRTRQVSYESHQRYCEERLDAVQDMISRINSSDALLIFAGNNQRKVQVLAMLENYAAEIRESLAIAKAKGKARKGLDSAEYSYEEKPILRTAQSEIERAVSTAKSSKERVISRAKDRGGFHRREKDKKVRQFLSSARVLDTSMSSSNGIKSFKQLSETARTASHC